MVQLEEQYESVGDQELIRRVAAGDAQSLGQLYTRHRTKVLTLAYRILGQSNLAEDVCHECFLRIQKSAGSYTPNAEVTTWIYKIVVNLCLDEKRKKQRQQKDSEYAVKRHNIQSDISAWDVEKSELSQNVWKALDKLNTRQRKAVILHKIEGLSHHEISDRTGWSRSSVESLLVRAYKKLREDLSMSKDE